MIAPRRLLWAAWGAGTCARTRECVGVEFPTRSHGWRGGSLGDELSPERIRSLRPLSGLVDARVDETLGRLGKSVTFRF